MKYLKTFENSFNKVHSKDDIKSDYKSGDYIMLTYSYNLLRMAKILYEHKNNVYRMLLISREKDRSIELVIDGKYIARKLTSYEINEFETILQTIKYNL